MFSRVPPISSVVDESTSAECKENPTGKVDSSETTDRSSFDRPKNVRADLWNVRLSKEKINLCCKLLNGVQILF